MLDLQEVSFSYDGETEILKNISFQLGVGESLGVLGPNGGGKSTLLKLIVGLLRPSSGRYQIEGLDIDPFPHDKFAYVAQYNKLNPLLPITLRELMQMGSKRSYDDDEIEHALRRMNLNVDLSHQANTLSRGQLQKALMSKALLREAKILVLDEPNTGLDSKGQDQLLNLLEEVKKSTAIIMVDHNLTTTIKHCDKVICLNKTFHWHDQKSQLTKEVIEGIYHCEFEHLVIHDRDGVDHEHHACHDHNHDHHHKGEK